MSSLKKCMYVCSYVFVYRQEQPASICMQRTISRVKASCTITPNVGCSLQTMPCQCNVTVLTTLSSSAHESSARTTLEADAYDYILSIWEDSLASSGGPQHVLRVQYFPMHVKVLGGVGFEVLLSETASKAIERDLHASATNDISYVRQV